jgi:hypothetical protein
MSKSTKVKQTPHTIDEMMSMNPMKISDATAQLRRKISSNERPNEAKIIALNNALVDRWEETVLRPNSKNGSLPAGSIHPYLVTFLEGRDVRKFSEYRSHLVEYPEDKVMYWADFLTNASMEDLQEMGPAVVSSAWGIIFNAVTHYTASRKWEEVYSQSEDPAKWARIAADHQQVIRGEVFPFGLTKDRLMEIEAKVMALLKTPIEPK